MVREYGRQTHLIAVLSPRRETASGGGVCCCTVHPHTDVLVDTRGNRPRVLTHKQVSPLGVLRHDSDAAKDARVW